MLEKEFVFFPPYTSSYLSLLVSVEAHSPFVQCVAWASAPSSETEGDSDRILNVVATGGTDKVREINITYLDVVANVPSFFPLADQNLEAIGLFLVAAYSNQYTLSLPMDTNTEISANTPLYYLIA